MATLLSNPGSVVAMTASSSLKTPMAQQHQRQRRQRSSDATSGCSIGVSTTTFSEAASTAARRPASVSAPTPGRRPVSSIPSARSASQATLARSSRSYVSSTPVFRRLGSSACAPGSSRLLRSPITPATFVILRKFPTCCLASGERHDGIAGDSSVDDDDAGSTSGSSGDGGGGDGGGSSSTSSSTSRSNEGEGIFTWGTPVGYSVDLPVTDPCLILSADEAMINYSETKTHSRRTTSSNANSSSSSSDSPNGHLNGTAQREWRRVAVEGKPSLLREEDPATLHVRPRRIILVRHGQSEGNVDESAYTRIPDSKIALTRKGWEQAVECGQYIKEMIEADGEEDWSVYFYVSPYLRCTQTLRGIGTVFERKRIAGVREEPRIREQDFGNFQCRDRMAAEKKIRLRYGRFFYRFPDGESAADVYDRVTGFRETLRADIDIGRFQRPDFASANTNLVLVSHGLTLRVFLMRWYKWTVKQFEGLYNFDNAAPLVMQLGEGGRYSLRIHQTREQLREFGMTEEMVDDQEWQLHAKPGDLNFDWLTSGPSFFDHFDDSSPTGVMEDYICEGLVDECLAESPVGERS